MTIKPDRRSSAWRGGGLRSYSKIEKLWPLIKAVNLKAE
jgi:hypothetical protein